MTWTQGGSLIICAVAALLTVLILIGRGRI